MFTILSPKKGLVKEKVHISVAPDADDPAKADKPRRERRQQTEDKASTAENKDDEEIF